MMGLLVCIYIIGCVCSFICLSIYKEKCAFTKVDKVEAIFLSWIFVIIMCYYTRETDKD